VPAPTSSAEPTWLEPFPDTRLEFLADPTPGPDALYQLRETVELAFIAAAGSLPPRQRAVLILRDVLGYRTSEVAEMLGTTEESVKGALKRARATLAADSGLSEPRTVTLAASPAERDLAGRFAHAFNDRDVPGLVALLTDQAWLSMPPSVMAYRGPSLISEFLTALLNFRSHHRGQLVPTRANGQVAFGDYLADRSDRPARLAGVMVLTLTPNADSVARIHWFINIADRLAAFGLPSELE
jgi:RNA polymerase sigma-70 factor (ECF subfamily)